MTKWQQVFDAKKNFPLMFLDVPIFKGTVEKFYEKWIPTNAQVLDFGSGNNYLKNILKPVVYQSVDIDDSFPHEYSSMRQVKRDFDVIVANSVLEHLSLEELKEIFPLFQAKAQTLVFNFPNAWASFGAYGNDYTHKTLLSFRALGGLLKEAGYRDVCFFRIADCRFIWIRELLARLLRVDFCLTIACIAKKW